MLPPRWAKNMAVRDAGLWIKWSGSSVPPEPAHNSLASNRESFGECVGFDPGAEVDADRD